MIDYAFGPLKRSVPRIGQGTWKFPERGAQVEEAKRALRRGVELGMVHVDTAEMYGDGRSEEIVGEAIADLPREQLFVVSKVLPSNAGYADTLRACERSLRRLRTDYLDVYLLHWRGGVPLEETMRAFEKLVDDGKIKALGVSNFDVNDLRDAQAALQRHPIACNQVLYHLGARGIEHAIVPFCRNARIAVVGYTPFGPSGPPGPRTKAGAALERIARKHGVTVRQTILAFLTREDGSFTIPKAADIAHVEENAAAGDLRLDDEDVRAIDAASPVPRSGRLEML